MNYNISLIKQNLLDSVSYFSYKIWFSKTWWSFQKRAILDKILKKNKISILVESWTYLWETVNYFKNKLKLIYSVELSQELADFSVSRFVDNKNVTILQWDSWEVISKLSPQIKERALFFLDGHYSGNFTAKAKSECPLIQEIRWIALSSNKNHIIVIDDLRLVWVHKDYPSLWELVSEISLIDKNYNHKIDTDMIIFYT